MAAVTERALVHVRVHVWSVGDFVEVRDVLDGLWYTGTVTQVHAERNTLAIHFLGWNSVWFDEEVDASSGRLRVPQGGAQPVSDWRHELQAGVRVEVQEPNNGRLFWMGEVTRVNQGTGHVYVRVPAFLQYSRWVHAYSSELRLPQPTSPLGGVRRLDQEERAIPVGRGGGRAAGPQPSLTAAAPVSVPAQTTGGNDAGDGGVWSPASESFSSPPSLPAPPAGGEEGQLVAAGQRP
jgi:hypothetical protein